MKNKSRATKAKELGLAGILAAGIGLSGCTGSDVFLDTYAQTAARDQYAATRRAAAGFAAGAIRRAEDAKNAREVAELGKPEVNISQNVNVGGGVDNNTSANVYQFEVGKSYDIKYGGYGKDVLYETNVTFEGIRKVCDGLLKGWHPHYEFRRKNDTDTILVPTYRENGESNIFGFEKVN